MKTESVKSEPYYKVDVEITSKDTVPSLCERFKTNSEALIQICIATAKALKKNITEELLINVVEEVINAEVKVDDVEQKLIKFIVASKPYRKQILAMDEEFFKKLGEMLLDERRSDIEKSTQERKISLPVNFDAVMDIVRDMISRVDMIDVTTKAQIWRLLINLLKLGEKYRVLKGCAVYEP